jgi:hypothetical protein
MINSEFKDLAITAHDTSLHHGRKYCALRPIRLRAGFDKHTPETELIRKGEEVLVLEIRPLLDDTLPHGVVPEFRILRCRTSLGWASLSTADGTELLRPVADIGPMGIDANGNRIGIPMLQIASEVAKLEPKRGRVGRTTSEEWAVFKSDITRKHGSPPAGPTAPGAPEWGSSPLVRKVIVIIGGIRYGESV